MNTRRRIAMQIGISLAIIAALVSGILFFGFHINKFSKKIATTRQELAERSIALRSLAVLRSEFTNKGQSYLNVLHNIVPKKDELIDLSKDIQAIAAAGNLEYGFNFLSETPAGATTLGSVRFDLSLGGDLNNLIDFIKNLQNFRYLINLENISLSREELAMKMEVRGNVFFRK